MTLLKLITIYVEEWGISGTSWEIMKKTLSQIEKKATELLLEIQNLKRSPTLDGPSWRPKKRSLNKHVNGHKFSVFKGGKPGKDASE